jgi:hypothetical protein
MLNGTRELGSFIFIVTMRLKRGAVMDAVVEVPPSGWDTLK